MIIVYRISLPRTQDPAAFVIFMRDEYFPAVHKGATRIGQVTDLVLLQQLNDTAGDDREHEFQWQVGWSGLPTASVPLDGGDGPADKLAAFGAKFERIGSYDEAITWRR